MPYYRVLLCGHNFWLMFEDGPQRMGFYTTRFVGAKNRQEAERTAVDLFWAEEELHPLNDPSDPPQVFVDETEEVERADVRVVRGFTFFPDKRDDA